jgi:hypothetical protein
MLELPVKWCNNDSYFLCKLKVVVANSYKGHSKLLVQQTVKLMYCVIWCKDSVFPQRLRNSIPTQNKKYHIIQLCWNNLTITRLTINIRSKFSRVKSSFSHGWMYYNDHLFYCILWYNVMFYVWSNIDLYDRFDSKAPDGKIEIKWIKNSNER